MAGFRQKLGDIRIPRRAGLALMASSAVLPVGLSAVGEGYAAQTSAWLGLPLVLMGALAWHGSGKRGAGVSRSQARRIARHRAFVVAAFSALLGSTLVSAWPREAAIRGSVTLNQNTFHQEAIDLRRSELAYRGIPRFLNHRDDGCNLFAGQFYNRDPMDWSFRAGLVKPIYAQVNGYGDVCFYILLNDRMGRLVKHRIAYDFSDNGFSDYVSQPDERY